MILISRKTPWSEAIEKQFFWYIKVYKCSIIFLGWRRGIFFENFNSYYFFFHDELTGTTPPMQAMPIHQNVVGRPIELFSSAYSFLFLFLFLERGLYIITKQVHV